MDYLWPKKIFVYIHLGLYIYCCPCININDIANGLGNNNGLAYAISMGLGACMTRSSNGFLNYCAFYSAKERIDFLRQPHLMI